jgi:hypothetical protein
MLLERRKFMKKIVATRCLSILFLFFVITTFSDTTVFAASDSDYLFSCESNNAWVLKKSTRKLMLVNFEKTNYIWKSKVITIPDEFNLNECTIEAVGRRGTSVFIFDKSSGLITLFSADDDGSIMTFQIGNLKEDLK